MVGKDSEIYSPVLATTLTNLGILYLGGKRMEEAGAVLKEALEIFREYARKDRRGYGADVERVRGLLKKLDRVRKEEEEKVGGGRQEGSLRDHSRVEAAFSLPWKGIHGVVQALHRQQA